MCGVDKIVVNTARFFFFFFADKGLDDQIVETVASLAIVCQFLWVVAVNDLSMSEKGVIMGRMFVSLCGVH